MNENINVDWLLLPPELWDYVFRYHVVDEYDALRLAQTCTALWEVYKGNGVKEWAWRNRWIREVDENMFGNNWNGTRRWSDGKKEGTWQTDGEPCCEDHWANGELHGLDLAWHHNRQLNWETHWVYGKQHGLSRSWYENGQLRWEENWVDGKEHGLWRACSENGVKYYEKNWVHGVVEDGRWW